MWFREARETRAKETGEGLKLQGEYHQKALTV